jgi:hypothetical protein
VRIEKLGRVDFTELLLDQLRVQTHGVFISGAHHQLFTCKIRVTMSQSLSLLKLHCRPSSYQRLCAHSRTFTQHDPTLSACRTHYHYINPPLPAHIAFATTSAPSLIPSLHRDIAHLVHALRSRQPAYPPRTSDPEQATSLLPTPLACSCQNQTLVFTITLTQLP